MNRIRKSYFLMFLALIMGMGTTFAYDFSAVCPTGQTLYYNIIDAANHYVEITYPGNLEIVSPGTASSSPWQGFTKPTGNITLPYTVTNDGVTYTVTSIGDYAFYWCDDLDGSLTIPNTVTTIGAAAFKNCILFRGTLTIPNAVTSIGEYAFSGCFGFRGTLTIPNAVTSIGEYAFSGCTGFDKGLIIGSSVSMIGDRAFYHVVFLNSITVLPVTPPTLGSSVFEDLYAAIPVFVPCGSLEDYQEASGWMEAFTNMQTASLTIIVQAWPPKVGTVTGGGAYSCHETCTVAATPKVGYQFLHWSNNGTVVNCNASYTFTVEDDVELEAVFMPLSGATNVIGSGETCNEYLPSQSYYNYTLSQQIYTSDELGGSQTITSISFFNGGIEQTRNYTIYMAHTTKTVFSGSTDWIKPLSSNQVFSGSVTMKRGVWTTIVLDTPFAYDGTSNLALIVDDNTGSYRYGMSCRVYSAAGNQTIKIQSDGTNYNPLSPYSYEGTLMTLKNQIILNRAVYTIAAATADASAGTVSGSGDYGYGDPCRLKATPNPGYTFMGWTDEVGALVSTEEEYVFPVKTDRSLVANFVEGDDFCSLMFDLHDSYGDGWNGNYLVVDLGNGVTQQMAVLEGEKEASYTLPVVDGAHVALNWIEDMWPDECSFEVRYSNGNIICAKRNLDEDYTYEFDMDCEGMSPSWAYVGDPNEMMNYNYLFPSASSMSYMTTGQIYTSSEIGTAGIINGMAFYNTGLKCTRSYDIYLKATEKTYFASSEITGSAPVDESDMVFSGLVTMYSGKWTPIIFDTPFEYNGNSNLLLVVIDNTGEESLDPDEPYTEMTCLAYYTPDSQAIQYDADSGFTCDYKNQLLLDIRPATVTQTIHLDPGYNYISAYVEITLADLQSALTATFNGTTLMIKSQFKNCRYLTTGGGRWTGSLKEEDFDVASMYIVVTDYTADVTLEGTPINPAEHPVIVRGNSITYIGFPSNESMTPEVAFAGFAVTGDVLKSRLNNTRCFNGSSNRWSGSLKTLEPGKGYKFISNAAADRTLVFPASK